MENSADPGARGVVVPLTGRLDASNSAETATRLATLIDEGTRILVLDMTALDYISSAGLGILMTAGRKIRAAGGEILFASVKPQLKQILNISGFTQFFKIVGSPDEAFRAG